MRQVFGTVLSESLMMVSGLLLLLVNDRPIISSTGLFMYDIDLGLGDIEIMHCDYCSKRHCGVIAILH